MNWSIKCRSCLREFMKGKMNKNDFSLFDPCGYFYRFIPLIGSNRLDSAFSGE